MWKLLKNVTIMLSYECQKPLDIDKYIVVDACELIVQQFEASSSLTMPSPNEIIFYD